MSEFVIRTRSRKGQIALNLSGRARMLALVVLVFLGLGVVNASSAFGAGNLVAMKGGDRSASNSVSGATNYASPLAGALFEYTTQDPTSGASTWTAFPAVTNASGLATASVAAGTYYVREKTPSPGFTNYGPVTQLSYNGAQPYVARVTVQDNQTSYAFPHTNTGTPGTWTPTNTGSATNNGSPFLDVRDNGTMPPGCGTNLLLVLDRSGSIEPYKDQYEAAAKQFVSSLNGTPTQIGIISFNNAVNSYQPAQGNASFYQSPLSLANAGSAATLNGVIENIYDAPTSLTNWDGVLQAASQAKSFTADGTTGQTVNPDMVVFITDGNPTTSQASTSGSNEDLINLTSGMASANLVKNQASRPGLKAKLLAIGVGTGVTIDNLKAVSGPDEGVDGDYAAPTIPELSAFLSELAASQCGARIYVRKLLAGQAANQPNWYYTASDPRPGKTPTYLDNNRATHNNGSPVVIQTGAFFSQLPATPTTVNVNEDAAGQPISNFELTSVDCRTGSYTGAPVAGGVRNGLQFSIPVNRGDAFYCTYTNAPKTTLSVVKTPDSQTIDAGTDAEFTIQVTNTGTNVANGVTLNDPLPAPGVGGWVISQQPGGNPCSIVAGALSCSFGNLNPGASVTVKVKTGTSFALCGVYDNPSAQASATNANTVSDAGKITCRKPELKITKSGNGPINAGQTATFTISVVNNGPGIAKAVTLSDPLPGGTAGPWTTGPQPPGNPCSIVGGTLNCAFGDLAAGQQVQVQVNAPTSADACATYSNLATAGASNHPAVEGSASITCQKPSLGTLKTAVSSTISAGDKAQFDITVSNTGPGTATGVTLSDPLPSGVAGPWTIVSQPAGNPCSITAGVLNCNFGDMPAGTSKSVRVEAATDFANCVQLVNVATASSTNSPSSTDDATILCQKPNLSVTKQGNGPVNAGEKVTFSIVVNNAGPGIARSAGLNDPLPSGIAGTWSITSQPAGNPCSIVAGTLTCSFGDLAAGGSRTVNIEASTDFDHCAQYDNTATATATNSPSANGSASVLCRKPSLTTTKSGNGTINAGEDVVFTIGVANSGPGTAKSVVLNDTLPAGTAGPWTIVNQPGGNPCSVVAGVLTCNFGDLTAGASLSVTVKSPTSAAACAKYDNTATATSTNAPNSPASASVTCQKPSLTVTKSGNGPVNAGENVQFSLEVKNGGPGTAKAVKLSDPLPTGVSGPWSITSQPSGNPCAIVAGQLDCDFGDLAAGESRSVTVSAATDFENCGTYNNKATGTAGNHAAVEATASISCLKPNLSITKTGNGTVNAGEDIEFTVNVTNGGPGEAKGVKVNDPLPTGAAGAWTISSQPAGDPCEIVADVLDCDLGDMAAGASAQVKVKAPTSHDACKLFENTASVSGEGLPGDEASATVNCQKPQLGTLKTAVEGTISAGDMAQFEITVSNTGPGTAKAVKLSDPLPTGVSGSWSIISQPAGDPCSITAGTLNCDFGDLPSGESRTVKVAAQTNFENCSQLVNLATASASNAPNASDDATINCQKPNLTLTKTGNGTVNAGEDVTFTMTLKNEGPGTAKAVKLTDPLPSGVAGSWSITSQPGGNPCSITAGTLNCDFGDLGDDATVSVTVSAATDFENCGTYVNQATGSASNHPNVVGTATDTCQKSNLGVLKTAVQGTISAGDKAQFEITVSNTGDGTAKGVTLNDPLPAGVSGGWSIVSQPNGNPCSVAAGVLNCDFGDLPGGESRTVKVEAATDFENCAELINEATASSTNAPDASDDATIDCETPTLTLNKTGNGTINAGETASFTLTIENEGPGVAKAVKLNDSLPGPVAGAWSIIAQPQGNPCSITAGVLNCDFGDLGEETRTVTVSAATDFENCAALDNVATGSASNHPNVQADASVECQKPDLSLLKTGNGTIDAGEDVEFELVASNAGPGVGKDVTVSDTLPTGTAGPWTVVSNSTGTCSITAGVLNCDFGDMAADSEASVIVRAPTNADQCGTYDNTAQFESSNAPSGSGNASVICEKPALKLVKSGNGPIDAGQKVKFTLTISNDGPGDATGVTLEDKLPNNVAGDWVIEAAPDEADCSIANRALNCEIGDLAAGQSAAVRVAAPTSDLKCATYKNQATGKAGNAAAVEDSATVNCRKPSPQLQLRKLANKRRVFPNETVRYRIGVRNIQPGSVARNLKICDRLPAQMTVASRGKDSFFENGKLCWRIERLGFSKKWKVFSYTARVSENVAAGTRLKNVVTLGDLKATRTVVVKAPEVSPARRVTPVTG